MITKVCGLTDRTDLRQLGALPVQWGGFIFVRGSPRYAGRVPLDLPQGVLAVGVFRDEPAHAVLHTARAWGLAGVQLHGDETPETAREIKRAGLFVVKAIGLRADGEEGLAKAATFTSDDVDYLLFDSPGGGTGQQFSWDTLAGYDGELPFLLAGGIGPDSRRQLAEFAHVRWVGIDLNSRFETAPGDKDLRALRTFLHA